MLLSSRLGQDSQLSEVSDVEGALAATSELEHLDERVAGLRDNAGSEAAGGLSLQPSTVGDLSTAEAESDADNDEDYPWLADSDEVGLAAGGVFVENHFFAEGDCAGVVDGAQAAESAAGGASSSHAGSLLSQSAMAMAAVCG